MATKAAAELASDVCGDGGFVGGLFPPTLSSSHPLHLVHSKGAKNCEKEFEEHWPGLYYTEGPLQVSTCFTYFII